MDVAIDATAAEAGAAAPMALTCAACAPGLKLCVSRCHLADDAFDCALCRRPTPETGCGNPTCAACTYQHAAAKCTDSGACGMAACDEGWADCDGNPGNGCETDLHAATSCGACGAACVAGQVCTPKGCQASCAPPLTACSVGPCVDLTSDAQNCGGCFMPCTAGQICQAGKCVAAPCTGGTVCNGACVDLATDAHNCGKCGTSCYGPDTATGSYDECVAGSCVRRCPPGFSLCGSDCVALSGSTKHCGSCGHACAATEVCVAGACTPDATLRLASGLAEPLDLTLEDANVYWTDGTDGTINRMAKNGGAVTPIATGQSRPVRIATDATHVYWTNILGGVVMRAPKAGGAPTMVSSAVQPLDIVLAGDSAYWIENLAPTPGVDSHRYELHKAPKGGGSSSSLASCTYQFEQGAESITNYLVKDGDTLYLPCPPDLLATNGLRVLRFDTAHGDAMSTLSGKPLYRLPGVAVSGPHFYHRFGGTSTSLGWFDKGTGAAVGELGLVSPTSAHYGGSGEMVASQCGLYWFGRAGLIGRGVDDLVIFQPTAAGVAVDRHLDQPRRIAVDATHLYWTEKHAIGSMPLP
jgi:hypothetical protein